jgi:hypothetical protein
MEIFKMTAWFFAKDSPKLGRCTPSKRTRFLNQGGLSRSARANAHPEKSIQ